MTTSVATRPEASEWVHTACEMCYMGCGILARVENGVVVDLRGDPDNSQTKGRICAKGKAGIMNLYNPHRVTTPLRRTNPEKGIGVDPRWKEISWDEAMEEIAEHMRQIRQDDARKLTIQPWTPNTDLSSWFAAFRAAFGTPNIHSGHSPTCGKVVHPVEYLSGGGFHQQSDFHYAWYSIHVGSQMGVASRSSYVHQVGDLAQARERGMKLVVVDPVGGYAASKADEWVPIRPGTDGAFGLGMLHVLLNELKLYDAQYLKHRTNSPYLVGPSGKYVRDPSTDKPLLRDLRDGALKTYDDPSVADPALEGEFEAHGQKARPAFELLKSFVAQYPPERVEEITTIPPKTLRRVAREFGEAARIGSTIRIDGVELPFRPVCVDWAKGPSGHKHGWNNAWPLKLLNIVMGAVNVPGGILSTGAVGKYPQPFAPEGGKDGLLEHPGASLGQAHPSAFPGRDPMPPTRGDIYELFPVAGHSSTAIPLVDPDPQKYGVPYRTEMVLHSPGNLLLGAWGDAKVSERFYQDKFTVGFAIEINETTEMDDVVLPFPTYLERDNFVPGGHQFGLAIAGDPEWHWAVRQKVAEPPPGVRSTHDVLLDLAERVGVLEDFYLVLSRTWGLREPHLLEEGGRYNHEDVFDRIARSWFGEEHGWAWFKEHGSLPIPRDVEERYPGPFLNARLPVYLEHFLERGEQLQEVTAEMGIPWDTSDYAAIPEWKPCDAFERMKRGECDAIGVHYKLPYVNGSYGAANPWIDELCERNPYAYAVLINTRLAQRKGIGDGDAVWLESPVKKVKAIAKVTQCVHPEVVGIAGHFGHWAQGKPISRGKGVNFNTLLPHDMEHLDMITTALDHCVPLKVSKA
ncbi:MAG: molybdopterin-dependent oxidoreductase [Chloroflexi bacterium]|nr:molybdopterin-dependent oxidoreductase [Chloroflexota bacterium]